MKSYLYKDLYEQEEKHWWHIAKRKMAHDFIKICFQSKKNKILDVGCGTGKNLEAFSDLGEVWGIDFSEEAIKFCRQRGLKKATRASAEKTPFSAKRFDCLSYLDVLEHVDDNKALKEAKRILKDQGMVIINVPAYPALWSKWDEVLQHKRRYTSQSLKLVLKQNGFKVLKISYVYSFLLLPVFIMRKIKGLFYQDNYPSDFLISSSFVNLVLGSLATIERFLIANDIRIPFGLSLIAIARKEI